MKRFNFVFLSAILLLSQWGSFDHVYHEHVAGEVCDYCISAQPLEHAVTSAVQTVNLTQQTQRLEILTQESASKSVTRYYAVRAPPRLA